MISRDISCNACGQVGKIKGPDTGSSVPETQTFHLLGKDSSAGFLHFRCPNCNADVSVSPIEMLSGQPTVGYAPSRRYVPIVWGIVALALGLHLSFGVRRWSAYILGAFCLLAGWASLKTGLFASKREIAELTGSGTLSEETKQKFQDRV